MHNQDIQYGFGQHLIIDAYEISESILSDINYIYNFLNEIVDKIGMTKVLPPYVFKYNGLVPEDWGLSGFCIIAESHISIHTFVEKKYVSFDVFSCKPFDVNNTIEEIKKYFNIQKYEYNILDRGIEFPRNIEKAKSIVLKDRSNYIY